MREIVPGVLTWPWYSERFQYDFNGYLVRHPDGNLCIDPVEMADEVLDRIAREGASRILLTNRNHFRAAARVRERTGARVAVHPADAAFVHERGVTVDDELRAGERVGPFTVIDAAGKSPGEVALHWPERRILIVGDACVGNPPGACGLLPEKVMDDPAALRRSLGRIADSVDFDVLLLADGAPILAGGRQALRALVARFSSAG
jgi:glyoxylase-like metal-dependent hydrolase (beta-lactamase superfamily II)